MAAMASRSGETHGGENGAYRQQAAASSDGVSHGGAQTWRKQA